MKIHPTAVISEEAEIAADVEIGPYVCIEGPVTIGAGCRLLPHAILTGHTTLGERNVVGSHTVLGGEPQDLSYRSGTESYVRVGSDNIIREYCTIHRGASPGSATVLGDGNFLMAGAHLGHNCQVGNHCIIANNVLFGGYMEVGDRAFVGGNSVFHQFVRIGRLSITQGMSAISKDVPPFTMSAQHSEVLGLNVVGLRRAGWSAALRGEVKRAFHLIYAEGLNVSQAVEKARAMSWGPEATYFFDFIAGAKRRGICSLRTPRDQSKRFGLEPAG